MEEMTHTQYTSTKGQSTSSVKILARPSHGNIGVKFTGALGLKHPTEKGNGC